MTHGTRFPCSIVVRLVTRMRALCCLLCALGTAGASADEPRFVTFEAPGAGAIAGSYQGTGCFGYPACSAVINRQGAITGYYLDASNVIHGFMRSPNGRIVTFDAPGADKTAGSFNGTLPNAINDEGVTQAFISMPAARDMGSCAFRRVHSGSLMFRAAA